MILNLMILNYPRNWTNLKHVILERRKRSREKVRGEGWLNKSACGEILLIGSEEKNLCFMKFLCRWATKSNYRYWIIDLFEGLLTTQYIHEKFLQVIKILSQAIVFTLQRSIRLSSFIKSIILSPTPAIFHFIYAHLVCFWLLNTSVAHNLPAARSSFFLSFFFFRLNGTW